MKIQNILPVPKARIENPISIDWSPIEEQLSCAFPDDYKTFISTYGTGTINNFIWIFTPYTDNCFLNYMCQFEKMKGAYEYLQNEMPEDYPKKFYNGKEGLLPWGRSDNGDELYWEIFNGKWKIVASDAGCVEFYEYPNLTMTEYLYKLLNGEIDLGPFPDDFLLEENYYSPV